MRPITIFPRMNLKKSAKSFIRLFIYIFLTFNIPMCLTALLVYLWPKTFQGPDPIQWWLTGLRASLIAGFFLSAILLLFFNQDHLKKSKLDDKHLVHREFKKLGFKKFVIKWSTISYLIIMVLALALPIIFAFMHGFDSLNRSVFSRYSTAVVFTPMIIAIGFTSWLAYMLHYMSRSK